MAGRLPMRLVRRSSTSVGGSDEAIHRYFRDGLLRGACHRPPPDDAERWIASRSLSSGAHSRDPLARNDGRLSARPLSVLACDKREAFAHGSNATKQSIFASVILERLSSRCAQRGVHSPICRLARSFMISSLPPPIALTLTSR